MGKILVTGAAGYIGTHTCVELSLAGYQLIALDNFCNSKRSALARVAQLTGRSPYICSVDLCDKDALAHVFQQHAIEAVIHLAGLKSVGESLAFPLKYYQNNLIGTLNLLENMRNHQVRRLVFSSSASIYGEQDRVPIDENCPIGTIAHPYGQSKRMIEQMLEHIAHAEPDLWAITILRYFNPVGAHESGLIGEAPLAMPTNLMPYIMRVAAGKQDKITVFGNDYPTPDGTGVRDYIHVVDLAIAHVKALHRLANSAGITILNLGTGQGHSVLELIAAFTKVCGAELRYQIVARRPGDIACSYADPARARQLLDWKTERNLLDMCRDSWHWQLHNPNGYPD